MILFVGTTISNKKQLLNKTRRPLFSCVLSSWITGGYNKESTDNQKGLCIPWKDIEEIRKANTVLPYHLGWHLGLIRNEDANDCLHELCHDLGFWFYDFRQDFERLGVWASDGTQTRRCSGKHRSVLESKLDGLSIRALN